MTSGPSPRGGSFRAQLVVLTAAVTALVAVVLTIVVQLVLASATTHSLDTVLEDRAEAVIGSASAGPGGAVVVPEERLDAGVAVYDAEGRLAAGTPPASERSTYADLATTDRVRTVEQPRGADESRVRAEPFTTPDGAAGVVVVTERLAPYERGERLALLVCAGAGGLMVVLAAVLAFWVSRRALAPVVAMTRAADDWSEHDLALRFAPGAGRDELAGLGRTLDRLLERVAQAIRSEQRLTSELAHELRTPLTAVQVNADLLLLDPALPEAGREKAEEIAGATRRMGAAIESLLELARAGSASAPSGSCLLLDAIGEALGSTAGTRVEVRVDPELRVLLPVGLAARALGPVLDNARAVAGRVVVSAAPYRPGFVAVHVDDDGPGIGEGERELVFEPGRTTGGGAGLGLPLSRRIARSAGGEVTVTDGPMNTRVVIVLPTA
ncbi:signal transduction histidine kinase [Nocardioides aromaticivorans]|uniref:histidine kinase n=1 Tax=Nocardioides aromaticivorans TaxID=200618 RepID=A0A7Y9ZHJ8_9ACTN|nr:HAMP domain-containing sensor histidine kinase [Nocardioides aromaticivorans]NYI44393.1 signal transduction histidine kinase [Nocardioides aromaticivorans]